MTFYEKNREALLERYPRLVARLDKITVKNTDVSAAKTGLPTLSIELAGRKMHIHSKYDPMKEAESLIARHEGAGDANFFLLMGIGLGYPLFELVRKVGWDKQIVVVEPQLAFLKLAMELFELQNYFRSPNITFFVNDGVDYITDKLGRIIDFARIKDVRIIEHPVSKQLMTEYYVTLAEAIKGIFVRTGGNLLTLMLSAADYQMNTLANLDEVVSNPPVKNLFDKFRGKPAIVISAGPSLDKNVHLLREINDKAVLISVETALKPLLAVGVRPHFVIAADPLEDNYKHLAGITGVEDTYLVAEPMTYPAILHSYPGKKFITTFRDVMMEWVAQFIGDIGFLMAWGSISTMGFDLARNLGCDPIIMIGQDLSFSGNRKYCHHTHWENSWLYDYERYQTLGAIHENFITIDKTREAIGIDGQKVATSQQLYAYRKWFEDEIKRTRARCYNATEGGVLEAKGLGIISLKEAIYRFCREPLGVREILAKAHQDKPAMEVEKLRQALGEVLEEMAAVKKQCQAGLELADKLSQTKENMAESQKVYSKLNEVISFINGQENLSPFLIMANQKGRYRFSRSQSQLEAKLASPEILEKTAGAYNDYYQSVIAAVDFMKPHFENAYRKVGIAE